MNVCRRQRIGFLGSFGGRLCMDGNQATQRCLCRGGMAPCEILGSGLTKASMSGPKPSTSMDLGLAEWVQVC